VQWAERVGDRFIMDGEVCYFNSEGVTEFTPCQRRCSTQDLGKIMFLRQKYPVDFMAFELLELNGEDYTKRPYEERKGILRDWLRELPAKHVRYVEHYDEPKKLVDEVAEKGGEGVILKRVGSTYSYKTRSDSWLKLRPWEHAICQVVGYTESSKRQFEGLILMRDGEPFGKVGGGFSDAALWVIWQKLQDAPRVSQPFPYKEDYIAVETDLKVLVRYLERTKNQALRFPIFEKVVHRGEASTS